MGATRQPRSTWANNVDPFDERLTHYCYKTRSSVGNTSYRSLKYMEPEDTSNGESYDQMNQVMATIPDMPRRLHIKQAKTKLPQTQEPVFERQQDIYNIFRHLNLKHIRPFQNKLPEDELQSFFSLLKDDAFEFWQRLHINPETLQDVLAKFKKGNAQEDFRKSRGTNGINTNLTHRQKQSTNF